MNDDQPAQPLTDERLAEIRNHVDHQLMVDRSMNTIAIRNLAQAVDDRADLLAEVDRLRAENTAVKTKCDGFQKMMNSAVSAGVTIDGERLDALREVEQLRAEATGTALGHLAKIERLQSERDALVRKLGLDWGPDEFGDLDAVTNGQQSCGDASIWSCAIGDHCVCKKTKHGGRHECACGSWWFRDK